jgi:outer membrane lipoprotein-sorting protein
MARMRRKLVAGMALLGLSGVTPAAAETVPLPKPGPQSKERAAAPIAPRPAASAQPQNPVSELANGLKSLFNLDKQPSLLPPATSTTAFTPAQRAQVDKVSAYLCSVQQMVGHFVQVAPDGSRSQGKFYVQKPGRVRFEYDAPSAIEIIADGQSLVVRDQKLATQDVYPLSQTPLRFLLADRIDLLRDTNVVAVRSDDVYVTVVIEERQALIGTSRLTMVLGVRDHQLKQWTVTDPQGYNTSVAVSQLDSSKRPDPNLFRVDYTRYAQ